MPDATVERLNAALEGRYRVERELGQGGMATVYLADDLRHHRRVALKVLKPELAAAVGADRFLAEIRTTANLQHPHILPLFDSGVADGVLFYVMPYVEGESLRDRLDREHQLPVDEATRIATDVAEALDHAHRHGVLHRDIKPENVLLRDGRPVISDFGISLAVGVAGLGRLTETGLSLGTPHYMSPEQATGDTSLGPPADVYALGCVLYEMLIGEPPYTGSTPQAILGRIITGELPSISGQRKSVPPHVEAVARRALEKVPADRFQSAADFGRALGDPTFRHEPAGAEPRAATASPWRSAALVATGMAALMALVAVWGVGRPAPVRLASRQVLSTRGWADLASVPFGEYAALAPDGSSMVLPLEGQLGLKRRGEAEIAPIRGTAGGRNVTYSPDGQWIAYALGRELYKRPLDGGPAVRLADEVEAAPSRVGLAWLDDGTILYEQTGGGVRLVRIPEDGGAPTVVFDPDGTLIWWVHGLPGARGALVVTTDNALHLVDLEGLSSEVLIEDAVRAWYVPTGHLVYVRLDGAVLAVPFDLDRLRVEGSAAPLFDGVRTRASTADMQISPDGTVLFVRGASGGGVDADPRRLVRVDRQGRETPIPADAEYYLYPRVSPDGTRLATLFRGVEGGTPTLDLWLLDLERGSRSRMTFDNSSRFQIAWTPGGDRLTYADGSTASVSNTIWTVATDGSGAREPVVEAGGVKAPAGWSSDGRALVYYTLDTRTLHDIWLAPSGGEPRPIVAGPFEERAPTVSPDGRWLAYVSDESGRDEVYLQAFPGPGAREVVSRSGGREPVWSRDGRELFFRTADSLMVAAVDSREPLSIGTPRALFADGYARDGNQFSLGAPAYDVMPDGRSFIMVSPDYDYASAVADPEPEVVLIQDFLSELERLAPR